MDEKWVVWFRDERPAQDVVAEFCDTGPDWITFHDTIIEKGQTKRVVRAVFPKDAVASAHRV